MKRRDEKSFVIAVLAIALVCMGIGYAALSATLTINGNATIKGAYWSVRTESIALDQASSSNYSLLGDTELIYTPVTSHAATGVTSSPATLTPTSSPTSALTTAVTDTEGDVTLNVDLKEPGATSVYTIKVQNFGTLKAKLNTASGTGYTVTIDPVNNYTKKAGGSGTYINATLTRGTSADLTAATSAGATDGGYDTYTLTITYDGTIAAADIPASDLTIPVTVQFDYVQANL